MIGRFIQEDTYYGDGLNLYTYCRNNPILNHDPTGHGTKENSPDSRKEQQYIDVGADPDTARLAAECYPDANSKKSLYDKYKKQGYNAQDAKKLANYEIVHGEERAKNYAANNVKKSGPDYTATFPRDNVNTDWRTQERVNAQRNAGAGKRNESGNKSGSGSTTGENARILSNNLAREGRPVGNGEAAAHIVASNGTKRQWASAADSRTLLMKYDIDINDAANGIPLGHPRPHNLTHNRAFHENVNARLHTVETDMLNNGYGKSAIRSALRRELRSIGREFENGIRN